LAVCFIRKVRLPCAMHRVEDYRKRPDSGGTVIDGNGPASGGRTRWNPGILLGLGASVPEAAWLALVE
jgi:hypothetical protein